jgi:quercetin dioxygenase-like cupin family protein
MDIKRSGSQPSGKRPAEYFTGTVRIDPLFQANAPSHTSGAYVTFEPGVRSAWHTHPLGQTLIVTAGLGRVQRWGGPIEEIRQGDVVWIPPGQKHWHGASSNTAMTHIAIQEHVDGKVVEWMEKVSDALCRMEVDANGCDRTTRSHNPLIGNDNVDGVGRGWTHLITHNFAARHGSHEICKGRSWGSSGQSRSWQELVWETRA